MPRQLSSGPAVTDPNGVTYQLQIDTNPDFSDPILNKTGIQSNSLYFVLIRIIAAWHVLLAG